MADVSEGTVLKKGTQAIGGITSLGGPGLSREVIDVTDLDDDARAKIAGLLDAGEVTLELNYEPDDTQHAQILTDILSSDGGSAAYSILFSDAATTTKTFTAFVSAFEPSASVGDKLSASVTLTITGTLS